MDISTITIAQVTSVAELVDLAESFEHRVAANPASALAFRGQPQQFGTLAPSFRRQFAKDSVGTAAIIERKLIGDFRKHYETLPDRTTDMPQPHQIAEGYDLRCLSVMQHYEIPTRLLDWTTSFWIAVYFACVSDPASGAELWYYDRRILNPQTMGDPALMGLLRSGLNPPMEPKLLERRGDSLLVELDPRITPRMKEQQAHHTVSTNVFADHAPLLHELSERSSPDSGAAIEFEFRRILIESSCKGRALQFLADHKGITASTIFPDVVGLGRFLRWQFESLRTMMF